MLDDFLHEALDRMIKDGLLVDNPLADGKLHRCPLADKPRGNSGAYLIHADNMPVAWWKNWVTDTESTYSGKPEREMSRKERKEFAERMAAIKAAARDERQNRWDTAAKTAQAEWDKAEAATDHPYLRRKGVGAFGLRVDGKGRLLVPVMDDGGKIASLQRILSDKPKDGPEKPFLHGGKTSGGYFHIPAKDGAKDSPLLICEGYATGASLYMATGHAVLVAFTASNLLAVTRMARSRYPERKICLCADYDMPANDREREKHPEPGGIGTARAKEAALATGAYLAISPAMDGGKSDFNDIHCRDGLARVQGVVEKALAGEPAGSCPMPKGYSLVKSGRNAGLYYMKEATDGTFETIRLGPPLEVMAETRDADGNDWGLFLKWHDNDGIEHTWAMPKTLLYMRQGEWFAKLAYGGWCGNPSCRKYIGAFLADVRPIRRIRCVDKTGWHGDCYVLPDAVYGQNANEDIVLQSLYHNELYKCAGTFENWQEMARLCVGNSRLGFALSCAFAGPLLKLAGLEGGCFAFEGSSSSGKTTALKVAASVWGGETHVRAWRSTDNGLEGLATLHNDNVLILDELSQVGARVLDEAVYMLANGSGKTRAGKDGNLRKPQRWLALMLSSGEMGLADKLAEDGRRARAGQDVRFCGIPVEKSHVDALHGLETANQLARRVNELCGIHYGHAGRMFLQRMSQPEILANAREKLRNGIEEKATAMCPENSDSQVRRVALRFALVGYAGTLATQIGLLPEDFAAMDYARGCFDAWLEQRGGAGALEDKAILEQVKLFIERDGQARFQNIDIPEQFIQNRLGFVKRNEDKPGEYIILPEQFRRELVKGYSEKHAASVLRNAGWLEIGPQGRNKTRRTLPGMGRQQVYVIHMPENNS